MDRLTRECLLGDDWDAELAPRTPVAEVELPGQSLLPLGVAANADTISARERMAWLASTIEGEIIPRLMLAHRPPPVGSSDRQAPFLDASVVEIEAFARLVMGVDDTAAAAHVESLRASGESLERIYLGLLAPTARYLGELWVADLCDFTAVTTALWRLQHLMYDLSPAFQRDGESGQRRHHALLAPVPGSQHTFGLLMVAEFFRRAGWSVWTQPSVTLFDLVEAVQSEWFDLIGFSVAIDRHIENLDSVILALRKASCNPQIIVTIGGAAMVGHPEYVTRVGADLTAANAPEAVRLAEQLVAARSDVRC
ncbi:cobalamin B12-binding domain-containing protein [Rivibacter subsaxonicus]|uniref:Methanogenic corrinoid protein MtbC1 n=1 Tax=Rivibacter subsaxonicus TaxID=457575 RepID=A0A4Q7W1S7_9BURK|nr:cobalamin-dependent protein [Rivibacter subsaxonicus]RZU02878.1 methanogenic corrinoid protein MtbC1 [Rivibacter subsaxonicus]